MKESSFITNLIEQERKDPAYDRAYRADVADKLMHDLVEARIRRNMSQVQIAEKMQTGQPSIARMEKTPRSASVSRMLDYALAVGVEIVVVDPEFSKARTSQKVKTANRSEEAKRGRPISSRRIKQQ
jgi:transcriptional regulator with XRE-family HTH domain